MIRNFGWNDKGLPSLGSAFTGEGPLGAAEEGELLFISREGDNASRLPVPLGTWIAIDHRDGLISIYSRFDVRREEHIPQNIRKNTSLGTAGISGWSNREGFYFSLFDRKERRWVNPSMIITPFQDQTAPGIQGVELRDAEGVLFNPGLTKSIKQGRYRILVHAADLQNEGADFLAPHRIVCSVNGIEIGELNFETYSARDGVLMVYRNGLVPVRQVYAPYPAFDAGEVRFNRGQATLEIIAQDVMGNSQSALYRLTIE
ncbi:MAG: M23 family metallopeptidase [Treponema sp.]|nr:M23 family metallopeptidase [Treponema sp.]